MKQENKTTYFRWLLFIPFFIVIASLVYAVYASKSTIETELGGDIPSKNLINISGIDLLSVGEADTKVVLFFDPICPGCGKVERALGDTFSELVDKNEIQMLLAPMNFLDSLSSDNYSTRASSAIVSVHQENSKNALTLMKFLYDKNFQPKEGKDYSEVSNEVLLNKIRQIPNVKNANELISKIDKVSYAKWVGKNTDKASLAKDFFADESDFSTPAVFIIKDGKKPILVKFTGEKDIKTTFMDYLRDSKK